MDSTFSPSPVMGLFISVACDHFAATGRPDSAAAKYDFPNPYQLSGFRVSEVTAGECRTTQVGDGGKVTNYAGWVIFRDMRHPARKVTISLQLAIEYDGETIVAVSVPSVTSEPDIGHQHGA